MQEALQTTSSILATILPSKHYFVGGGKQAQERLGDLLQVLGHVERAGI